MEVINVKSGVCRSLTHIPPISHLVNRPVRRAPAVTSHRSLRDLFLLRRRAWRKICCYGPWAGYMVRNLLQEAMQNI